MRQPKREERWEAFEEQVRQRLDRARRRFLLATDFDEMEEIAVEEGAAFERELLEAGARLREPETREVTCPKCGGAMKRHDRVARHLKTCQGKVKVERERWVCPGCGETVFPPG
jgi:YgiT-type zinc finger domain-containing protein